MKRYLGAVALSAIVPIALWAVLSSQPALALADSLSILRAYQVSCATTATAIAPSDGIKSQHAWSVWNNSATPVYVGGSDVTTTTKGWPICTDTASCPSSTLSVDAVTSGFCRVGSGTVTLTVISGRE